MSEAELEYCLNLSLWMWSSPTNQKHYVQGMIRVLLYCFIHTTCWSCFLRFFLSLNCYDSVIASSSLCYFSKKVCNVRHPCCVGTMALQTNVSSTVVLHTVSGGIGADEVGQSRQWWQWWQCSWPCCAIVQWSRWWQWWSSSLSYSGWSEYWLFGLIEGTGIIHVQILPSPLQICVYRPHIARVLPADDGFPAYVLPLPLWWSCNILAPNKPAPTAKALMPTSVARTLFRSDLILWTWTSLA